MFDVAAPLPPLMVAILAMTVASLLQLRLTRLRVPSTVIGDEGEYLSRSRSKNPFGPQPFLRMPLLILLACLFRSSEKTLRTALVVFNLGGVGLVAYLGSLVGGAWALVPLALWLILPERTVLSERIWPEAILGPLAFALCWVLWAHPIWAPAAAGVLCALAVLTRIDGAVWAPIAAASLAIFGPLETTNILLVVLPTGLVIVGQSMFNLIRYGIPLPETTTLFNLLVCQEETRTRFTQAPFAIATHVDQASAVWRNTESARGRSEQALIALKNLIKHPMASTADLLRRGMSLLGRETFVSEQVALRRPAPYRRPPGSSYLGRKLLHYGGSVLLGSSLALFLWLGPRTFPYALPSAGAFIMASAVHTRTRFRQPLLGVAVIVLSDGLARQSISGAPLWKTGTVLFLGVVIPILGSIISPRPDAADRPSKIAHSKT